LFDASASAGELVAQGEITMRVMIVGAGIGGLTTALSLHAAGIDTVVYESVPEIKPLGFGINLQPNAICELIGLDLGDALAATGIETSELRYYNKHGQLIWSEPRGLAAGYAWPQYAIGRGDLQKILLNAAKGRIGAQNVLTGCHLISFEQDHSGVTARFVDRERGKQIALQRGDALVGCDGIHSAVRSQLYPYEGAPVSSGYLQWRGTIEAEPFLDGRTNAIIGFSRRRGVVYPIGAEAARRGCARINWLTVLADPSASAASATWDNKVSKDRFFHHFKDWNFGWMKFADLISDTNDIYEFSEQDREPLPRWSFGRVTLVGDAAHPMRPHGAQAGSQAIVDARVVARTLASEPTVEQAFEAYDGIRRPIMNAVTIRNRKFGPSIVMELAEQRAPRGFAKVEDVIPRRELEQIARAYKVEAGFDAATVNLRSHSTRRHTTPLPS
jgi:2-polyprenyl-6-methoxyphenol hydroxylase-like FAD-dependent oxidoreductase